MKDFLGNELAVGDRVVYGGILGRCAAVGVGHIVELNDGPPRDEWHEPNRVKIAPEFTQHEFPGSYCREEEREPHKPRWFKYATRMVKLV